MTVHFHCSSCGRKLHIDAAFAGRPVACPRCGAKLMVPLPNAREVVDEPPQVEFAAETLNETVAEDVAGAAASLIEFATVDEPQAPKPAGVPAKTVVRAPSRGHDADFGAPLTRPPMRIDHEELIDMTAMVDIVFFLLIFFLVTSMEALHASIPMPTPSAQGNAAGAGREPSTVEEAEADDEYVVVNIDRNNFIDVGGVAVVGPDELLVKLRELRGAAPHPTKMLVVGHAEATHGTMVMVLDCGYDAGMEKVKMSIAEAVEE